VHLNVLDWIIILGYCAASVLLGLWFSRRNRNREDYFVAGRKLNWFVAGTSIVATYLAVDTPLAVSGFIRRGGIYENWFWWTAAFSGLFTVFFFARLWNRAKILTDVEFIEFRYSGRAAAILRIVNAFLKVFGLCICNGWVILAAGKIVKACFNLPPAVSFEFGAVSVHVSTNIVIYAVLLILTLTYTMFSGLWGVVMTDVLHFFAAMFGFILLAAIVVVENNGPAQLVENVINSPGVTSDVFDFFPNFKTAGALTVFTFFVYIGLLWWWSAAGVGIVAQRMLACKDGRNAGLAVIWGFSCVVVVRSWPWIIVGLASLIYFPIIRGEDPELAFPKMMVKFLPGGMAGIVLAAFIAAFLSTVAANLNLAASYLMNDFYVRVFKKQENAKDDYLTASKLATVIVLLFAVFVTWQMQSIASAWKYLAEIYAGTGFVMLFRWFWWRINAWSEISAMVSSFILANVLKVIPALSPDNMFAVRYVIIISVCTIIWFVVTLLTAPENKAHLEKFYNRVAPGGWWGTFADSKKSAESTNALSCWTGWIISVVTIYLGLFGTGLLCLAEYKSAVILLTLFGIGIYFSVREISKVSVMQDIVLKASKGAEV